MVGRFKLLSGKGVPKKQTNISGLKNSERDAADIDIDASVAVIDSQKLPSDFAGKCVASKEVGCGSVF